MTLYQRSFLIIFILTGIYIVHPEFPGFLNFLMLLLSGIGFIAIETK